MRLATIFVIFLIVLLFYKFYVEKFESKNSKDKLFEDMPYTFGALNRWSTN